MLEYESPHEPLEDGDDEWKTVRACFAYLCFTCPVALAGIMLRHQEWVDAGSPTDNRTNSEFLSAVATTLIMAMIAGGIFVAAAAIGSWGRMRFRRVYPIWLALGGAIYPCLEFVVAKMVRASLGEWTLIAASAIYTLVYPIALGLFVIARRPR